MDYNGRCPPESVYNKACGVTDGRMGKGTEESVVMTGGCIVSNTADQ